MNLPQIAIDALPVLEKVTGLFGSAAADGPATVDDRIIVLMVYTYEIMPVDSLI